MLPPSEYRGRCRRCDREHLLPNDVALASSALDAANSPSFARWPRSSAASNIAPNSSITSVARSTARRMAASSAGSASSGSSDSAKRARFQRAIPGWLPNR